MTTTSDAIVIGGGLHGLSAALQLTRRGLMVVLLERQFVGRHSSGASAAGVRTLGRAPEELPLSLVAMKMWHEIAGLVGDDCGFHANGQLHVAETEAELTRLRDRAAKRESEGFFTERMIDRADLHEIVPTIASHCLGAAYAPLDGAADPHRTLTAYYKSCTDEGVTVCEGCAVTSIRHWGTLWQVRTESENFEAPLLVNAAGAWAAEIAAMCGDIIPLDTKASMMIVTERVGPFILPTVGSLERQLSFKQTTQGTLLIGGGRQGRPDLDREEAVVDTMGLAHAAAATVALFPSTGHLRVVRSWAGLEAKTADNISVVGLSPNTPGLMHLFGFSGHGFQLVPAAGVVAAELLVNGHTAIDLSGLSPARLMVEPVRRAV
ncbi:FAD-dependent oxidoreductase [Nostoc sp. 3335mG]|nr:FAD-dependent oxidoreductase [Nostoc sp. 3335mG]